MTETQKKEELRQKTRSQLEEFNRWWDKVSQDIPKVNGQRVQRSAEIKDIDAWLKSAKREAPNPQTEENLSSELNPDEINSSESEPELSSKYAENIDEIKAWLDQVDRKVPQVNGQRVRGTAEIKDINAWLNSARRTKPSTIQFKRKKQTIINPLEEKRPQLKNFAEQTGDEVVNSFLSEFVPEELKDAIPSIILEQLKIQLSSEIREYLQNRLAWALNSIWVEAKNSKQ